jgi:hypothetical protein
MVWAAQDTVGRVHRRSSLSAPCACAPDPRRHPRALHLGDVRHAAESQPAWRRGRRVRQLHGPTRLAQRQPQPAPGLAAAGGRPVRPRDQHGLRHRAHLPAARTREGPAGHLRRERRPQPRAVPHRSHPGSRPRGPAGHAIPLLGGRAVGLRGLGARRLRARADGASTGDPPAGGDPRHDPLRLPPAPGAPADDPPGRGGDDVSDRRHRRDRPAGPGPRRDAASRAARGDPRRRCGRGPRGDRLGARGARGREVRDPGAARARPRRARGRPPAADRRRAGGPRSGDLALGR